MLILYCLRTLDASNSCNDTYITISDVRRSTAYTSTITLCDRDFIKDGKWYRFKSAAGDKMPEHNPGLKRCGTYVPIWLNGKHPTSDGETVTRTACAPLPWTFPFNCGLSYNIKVINCGSFFLYQLKPPDRCSLAYCAGSKLPKNCSSDGTSIPVCPGVVPAIAKLKVAPKDEDRESVALSCSWECRLSGSNVEFNVRWFRDSKDTSHTVEDEFNGTTDTRYERLYEHVVHGDRKTGDAVYNPNGYQFNKEPFCQVRARFHGGSWSAWISSQTIFTGIAVHPKVIYLHECLKNKEVFVSLTPHLPIRKKPFRFEIGYNTDEKLGKICIRGQMGGKYCLTTLTESHSIYRPFWMRITAICPSIETRKPSDTFEVKFNNPFDKGENNPFWSNYDFPRIKISLASNPTKMCKSLTDPNIETFDGKKYNPDKEGTFRLYRNRHSGTEVQARLDYCCNCGVAIREGYFFKIFDLCTSLDRKDKVPVVTSSHFPDSEKSGFYTETLPREDGSQAGVNKIVHLPSGITVTVKRRTKSFDIIIKAPKPYADVSDPGNKHSEGLCGNFNGDASDDFEGWTMSEFADLHRIKDRSADDIFAYRGNKQQEELLYMECEKEKLCFCKSGIAHDCDTPNVTRECFPPERSHQITHLAGDLCRGGRSISTNSGRSTRSLDTRDDDIDDQDEIPPYNPPQRNRTAPTWPTPSNLTEHYVRDYCDGKIRYSKAGESCSTVTGVDMDGLVNQCISDIKITDDLSWAMANFGAMDEICKKNVYKNISYYKNNTDGTLKLETDVLDSLCPNDCSGHGNCSNSTCTCFEDYTSPDCSISLKDSPILYGIRKSGLCDVRKRPCRNVGIYAFPLLDSENLTCHVQEVKVIESPWIPDSSITLYPGLLMDLTEVKCALPESPVNIGDYGNVGVAAAGLKIAVSNNRINASKNSLMFITYDSVCQECNSTTGCQLKSDACIISGHCFAKNESYPNDWCQQCLPEISTTSWSERRDNQPPMFKTSSVLHAFLGRQLRVQLTATDRENRTIQYSFAQNKTLGASLTEAGFFTWTKNDNESTIFRFKVKDECGAFSVLTASVVIKECPCENSGECFPDYRYLDGAGNFTCSCPAEYTGTLCEFDVDECAVSKPCFNGTCKNEQPGFSCSCLAGYTGDFCQTEVDECASNPCFPGVTCKDLVAAYSCGSCLSGYTGNGENCTRFDGKVDQCVKDPQICHSNASCLNKNGSYHCHCSRGYNGDGRKNCTDINECSMSQTLCAENAHCLNTAGSYVCECYQGYSGDSYANCTDVNECIQTPDVCQSNANCSNTEGSYVCECLKGYSGDGKLNCSDVNECHQNPNVCHGNASCTNTEGSYSCECSRGYTGDGKLNCSDMNECSIPQNVCGQNSQCSNTDGSYTCKCNPGYSGDADTNCTDVNECIQTPDVCDSNANCSNTEGSHACECLKGYTGDGKLNCSDIDECTQLLSVCHQHAKCINKIGSYSCQCKDGFLGDGIKNCTENQPPKFITPNEVLAILRKEFQFELKAEDLEEQKLAFTILANGTLTTAKLTKASLLTIPKLASGGTVYIQVADEMGAKNILVLQVKAMECLCENNGKCYQNESIVYAVKASDYLCECEKPYTGRRCEIGPSPCDEEPCYPGLKCSAAQNSEGFTCEKCPPSFEGDGKHCDLSNDKAKSLVETEMTLINLEWDDQLKIKTSKQYKKLASQLILEIRKVYKDYPGFEFVIVHGFRRGSIIVEIELMFTKEVNDPLKPLMVVAKTGKLGNMTVEMKEDEKNGERDNKTILFVIIGAVIVLILMISITIYLRIKRHRTYRKEELMKKRKLEMGDPNAKGIESQPNDVELGGRDGGGGENIDLKVFDNEAVCLDDEESKIQP